ncbi:MAG: helix-loop-helix DNA-binding domain-containing protein [Benjaminiella poitrasii]|nr:MAG: helix-loop-helix DNA-binding domain-containing protein [Benjaminiella poitrasii]
MYSPPESDYHLESPNNNEPQFMTPHTTVSAVPVVRRNNNNNHFFNSQQRQQQTSSFTSAMNSPPNNQAWFGSTSFDSTSSFGQSPTGRDELLIVSPSNSSTMLTEENSEELIQQQQRNLQEIFEKRRRRRESHNAVERRRRDNINERIHELCSLLPERLIDTAPTSSNVMAIASAGQVGANGRAINKGTILKLSVDHIKELREDVSQYQARIRELEGMIERAKKSNTRHQRGSSIQFQQQFNNLHIDNS